MTEVNVDKILRDPVKYLYVVTKARQDPIFFIRNILGSNPYPKQEEIIREFYRKENGQPKYRKLIWCSGMRCLHGDTEVMTQYGVKKIKDLREGVDLVLQWDFGQGKAVFDTFILHKVGKKKMYKVTFSNGRYIIASEDHEFLTDFGFKKLSELSVGDYVAVPKGEWIYWRLDTVERVARLSGNKYLQFVSQFYWTRIVSIEYWGEDEAYDLTTPNENYIAEGVIVHNSGKSKTAAWLAAYELFCLCTLKDPATYYGLDKGSRITINIVATSTETAEDAIFGQLKHMIKNSELFQEVTGITKNDVKKEFIICEEKNVKCQLLSSWTTTGVGRTAKMVIFDEMSYFEETAGKRGAWEVYTRLSKAADTLGMHGKVVVISSPKHPNDIIMTLIKNHQNDPHALCYITPTWEVNPNLTFEQLWEEHKANPAEFWRDYGCKPTITTALQFPNGVKLQGENKAMINDLVDHEYLRVMAIDPAVRKDAFGIAFGYVDENGKIIIDGAYRFTKLEEQPFISPREIKEYLADIIHRYNIIAVVFDTWMYPELIEWMSEELGLITVQHIVKKEDYDRLSELLDNDQIQICEYDVLKKELESLLIINDKKVDHPYGGSKDVADCVANVVWFLTSEEYGQQIGEIRFSPSLVKIF